MERVFTIGMNIAIVVQTTLNAKRKKRRGKKIALLNKPKLPRVIHIFKTGKLKDRTHYREVDPYWGIMWRQYEYLRYMEFYLKKIISQAIDDGILDLNKEEDKKIYDEYIELLKWINKHKKKLVHWLFNAFHIQIGGVLSARFYGWKEYADKFVGRFYEIAADLIQKLRFDIDKTRCSVYFYQAFWLGGLSVINEIRKKLYTEKNISPNFNRGNKLFSLEEFEDFDNIDFVSQYIEEFGDYSSSPSIEVESEEVTDIVSNNNDSNDKHINADNIDIVNDNEVSVSVDELDNIEQEDSNLNDEEEQEFTEKELKLQAINVLRRLMAQAGIPIDVLYSAVDNERKLNKLIKVISSRIKKKLRKGEIELSQEDKRILSLFLGRPI